MLHVGPNCIALLRELKLLLCRFRLGLTCGKPVFLFLLLHVYVLKEPKDGIISHVVCQKRCDLCMFKSLRLVYHMIQSRLSEYAMLPDRICCPGTCICVCTCAHVSEASI